MLCPEADLPPTQEKHLHHRWTARTMSSTKQGQLLFSSTLFHLCVFMSNTLYRTHTLGHLRDCVWANDNAGLRLEGPTSSFGPGKRSSKGRGSRGCGVLNLAGECPCLCLSCCFMNPLLHTSTQCLKWPFVILIMHL